jgi:light-regulated signal transduction histidine kinase (bacteriophytochrome)
MEAFSYSVSHDLRAPLRAIDGFSRFLHEDYGEGLDEEGRRLIATIRKNTQRMDQLIGDLLRFSRITKGEPSYTIVDMRALAEAVCAEAVPAELRATFELTIGELRKIRSDASLLRQVWVNLVSNAFKYSMKSPKRRIEIGSSVEGDLATYWVRDEGAGFDPDYAEKLFGVFQRLHRIEEFEGNGIGLALVQRIISRLGGRVWATGRPNEGACFFFALPVGEGGSVGLPGEV